MGIKSGKADAPPNEERRPASRRSIVHITELQQHIRPRAATKAPPAPLVFSPFDGRVVTIALALAVERERRFGNLRRAAGI